MKIYIFLGLIVTFFCSHQAEAIDLVGGGQGGNGADAVVCMKGFKVEAELLDIYEARVLLGKVVADPKGHRPLSYYGTEGARAELRQMDHLPSKSARLHKYLETFLGEAIFVPGVELSDIPDSLQVVLPAGCQLAQLVIQNPNPRMGQKRYTINQDLWDLLDPSSRVGAVLHEIIYRDQILLGHTDSRWTRYLNALILSHDLGQMSTQELNAVFRSSANESFFLDGLELLGNPQSGQKFFQVVGTAASSSYPALLEGRYDLKAKALLDYTTLEGGEILGMAIQGPYSVELSNNNPAQIYFFEAHLPGSAAIFPVVRKDVMAPPWTRLTPWAVIKSIDSNGDILFEPNTADVQIPFSNGVRVSTTLEKFNTRGFRQDWLKAAGCTMGECPAKTYTLKFGENTMSLRGHSTISYDRSELIAIHIKYFDYDKIFQIKNRVPPGAPSGSERYTANFLEWFSGDRVINFKANGDFWFKYLFPTGQSFENNLIARDGTLKKYKITEQYSPAPYVLSFDRAGYLLDLYPGYSLKENP